MLAKSIQVGKFYRARVGSNLVTVEVVEKLPQGGWTVRNTVSNRKLRFKTADRFKDPSKNPSEDRLKKSGVKLVEAIRDVGLTPFLAGKRLGDHKRTPEPKALPAERILCEGCGKVRKPESMLKELGYCKVCRNRSKKKDKIAANHDQPKP